jgi:hypothetical protein
MNEIRNVVTILNLCPDLFCPWANPWTEWNKERSDYIEFMQALRYDSDPFLGMNLEVASCKEFGFVT